MSEERKHAVLRAIVEGYVETSEPVGSVALAAGHSFGVSPATIRNDMASLEEEGLIAQPHTSAGRIPTDLGYRYFVDHLTQSALPGPQRRAIAAFLSEGAEVGDVVERAVKLLSQLTRQVAVVQYPMLRESAVRRVEVVRMGTDRALVVVVSADARVEQSTIVVGSGVSHDEFDRIARECNEASFGLTPAALTTALDEWAHRPSQPEWAFTLAAAVVAAARGGTVDRVVFAGTANLARADFESHAMGSVLDALEEQVVLLRLLNDVARNNPDVSVRIGSENRLEGLRGASIVAAEYGGAGHASLLGTVGPTRMDYPTTMAAVRAVARYLSRAVETP